MRQREEKHPRIVEISPDIYWIDGDGSNLFLFIEAENGLTLVDCGFPKRAGLVFEIIAALGFQKRS